MTVGRIHGQGINTPWSIPLEGAIDVLCRLTGLMDELDGSQQKRKGQVEHLEHSGTDPW